MLLGLPGVLFAFFLKMCQDRDRRAAVSVRQVYYTPVFIKNQVQIYAKIKQIIHKNKF